MPLTSTPSSSHRRIRATGRQRELLALTPKSPLAPAKNAAGDAAKEIKAAGEEAGKLERARASDELKKTARAADQAAASLGRVATASAADDGTGRASKIRGGSMARIASGEQGRNQWNRLAEEEGPLGR